MGFRIFIRLCDDDLKGKMKDGSMAPVDFVEVHGKIVIDASLNGLI